MRPGRLTAGELRDRLLGLQLRVDRVRCLPGRLFVPDYPGRLRPTGLVVAEGAGLQGYGEHVAFTLDEQRDAADTIPTLLDIDEGALAQLRPRGGTPYARAALEAALIDLALRQNGATLATLTGEQVRPLRYVVSRAPLLEPALEPGQEYKLDVHEGWSDRQLQQLAAHGGVAILDFKERDGAVELLAARLPHAIFEDPTRSPAAVQVARDAPVLTSRDAVKAWARGEAVNLKAPRMGGFLELLDALAARPPDALAYLGGMHEVGPGREQARQLAALFTGDGPNDLGPIDGSGSPLTGPSPALVPLDVPGFGGWSPGRWTDAEVDVGRVCARTR